MLPCSTREAMEKALALVLNKVLLAATEAIGGTIQGR